MDHRKPLRFFIILSAVTLLWGLSHEETVWSADSDALRQGINDYNNENYEEAIESLLKAVQKMPSSAEAAYYTGLTYKELLHNNSAKDYLKKALSLKPSMTEIYVPLAEVLYSLGKRVEAEKYLKKANSKGIKSARASYLKGLILLDRGKKKEAARAFQRAINIAPPSEAALLSGEALNTIGYKESHLALSAGYTFQYDDNVILKPSREITGIAVSDEEDTRHVLTAGGDYSTRWDDRGLRVGYSFYQSLHRDLDPMDVQAHSLFLIPSFETDRGKILLPVGYDYYLIDNDKYLKMITLKPSWVFSTDGGKGVNLFAGALLKDFLQNPLSKEEERDGTNINAGLAILFPFNADRSYVKVNYTYDSEDTDGDNWDYSGHRGGVRLSHPLAQAIEFVLAGRYYQQDYKNKHITFGKKRADEISSIETGLTYSYRGIDLSLRYSYTDSNSNIAVFDYSRNIAGMGVEYTF
ncbi:MAG: DUF2860 family protein [Deltaproteobacteria bacterium]|nr:DUF2860 family protein [Deltaproteobacteria bacterium]